MTESSARRADARLVSIDTARFFAIVLVFYGHLVEQVMYLENTAAATHYKWVYSFHMPLFFLLSGIVFSDRKIRSGAGAFFGSLLRSRLVPYFVFTFALGAGAIAVPGWFPTLDLGTWSGYADGAVSTLLGLPAFNIPLWFLASLTALEVVHFFLARFWTSQTRLALAAVAFYVFGYYLNRQVHFFESGLIFWMAHVVPLGYAFYLTGMLLRRSGLLEREFHRWQLAAAALLCLAGVFLTYDLNQGPFRLLEVVVMMFGSVGNILLFPITALLGSAAVILLARLAPRWRFLHYLGEITLLIYCLHGVFYHFVNPPLASWMANNLPVTGVWGLFVCAGAAVVLSVAATIPVAVLIHRFLPQVIGRTPPASAATTPPGRPEADTR